MSPSLADLAHAAEDLRHEEAADLLQAASLGDQLESLLWNPTELVAVSTAIAERAEQLGCKHVVGASDMGGRLAAAAVAVSNNGLTGPPDDFEGKRVCVVDGIVSTGWNIRRARAELIAKGASAVVAVGVVRGILSEADDLDAVFLFGG